MAFPGQKNYRHGTISRIGVLLVNLGTPEAPTAAAVRRYLREFLSDPRVVELPRPLWWLILHLAVLPFRSGRTARAYQKIWLEEGSPLLVNTLKQADALGRKLAQDGGGEIIVEPAVCYGRPNVTESLDKLRRQNVRRLLVLPLYPQYSATTTAAVFDLVTTALRGCRWLPELRFITRYYDDDLYVKACATRIRAHLEEGGRPHKLLFSFHGLPRRNLLAGDPYHCHCQASGRLIADELGLQREDWDVAFQSRFGWAEWLKPYTDEMMRILPTQDVVNIAIFCPGFASDCLETLEEIAIRSHEIFTASGGRNFRYIPALNDSREHIECLAALIKQHISGWSAAIERENDAEARRRSRERARAMGSES